jgi:hypothetical protein
MEARHGSNAFCWDRMKTSGLLKSHQATCLGFLLFAWVLIWSWSFPSSRGFWKDWNSSGWDLFCACSVCSCSWKASRPGVATLLLGRLARCLQTSQLSAEVILRHPCAAWPSGGLPSTLSSPSQSLRQYYVSTLIVLSASSHCCFSASF